MLGVDRDLHNLGVGNLEESTHGGQERGSLLPWLDQCHMNFRSSELEGKTGETSAGAQIRDTRVWRELVEREYPGERIQDVSRHDLVELLGPGEIDCPVPPVKLREIAIKLDELESG